VIDYAKAYPNRVGESMGEVTYAELKSGTISLNGKQIPTGSLSSYTRALEIAETLKKWIKKGDFLLTEPVASLPGADSGYRCKPLKHKAIKK
jgi:uncharacterized protein (DUF39 family)